MPRLMEYYKTNIKRKVCSDKCLHYKRNKNFSNNLTLQLKEQEKEHIKPKVNRRKRSNKD